MLPDSRIRRVRRAAGEALHSEHPGLHAGFREGASVSLGLNAVSGMFILERAGATDATAPSRRSGMMLFGVLWAALLAAELWIAYQFLKAKIRHH